MTNPNDPAFSQQYVKPDGSPSMCGLTKREFFVAMLAHENPYIGSYLTPEQAKQGQEDWVHNVISNADALITELNKEPK